MTKTYRYKGTVLEKTLSKILGEECRMRPLLVLLSLLILFILICGCASSTDTSTGAIQTPTVTVIPTPSAQPEPTFVSFTIQYTPLPTLVAIATPQQNEIIGTWTLEIAPNPQDYTGSAQFNPDGTGTILYGIGIPEESEPLLWQDLGGMPGIANVEIYNITVNGQSVNATISQSGRLTTDFLPGGAYLSKTGE